MPSTKPPTSRRGLKVIYNPYGHSEAKPGLERYLEKVSLWGGSAERTFAVQADFTQPTVFIKAVIATYPGPAIEANLVKIICRTR